VTVWDRSVPASCLVFGAAGGAGIAAIAQLVAPGADRRLVYVLAGAFLLVGLVRAGTWLLRPGRVTVRLEGRDLVVSGGTARRRAYPVAEIDDVVVAGLYGSVLRAVARFGDAGCPSLWIRLKTGRSVQERPVLCSLRHLRGVQRRIRALLREVP
jgi:hypothetical protein